MLATAAKITLAALLSITATGAVLAQSSGAPPAKVTASTPAPKLVVVIAVDQFSADLFAEYRSHFTGGLARLASGVVFPAGYQSHAATETCPGHSTILTGNHPAHTGIIANNYFDLSVSRDDKRVYCAEDETVAGTTSGSGKYAPSVNHLLVPTLGDLMKAANPKAQVVSVAGKDRAAIMMGGHKADELMWLVPTGLTGYRGTTLSPTAQQAGTAIAAAIAQPRPAATLPADCASHDIAIPLDKGGSVGTGRFQRDGGDFRRFMASPEADGAVLAAGAALRQARGLGEGDTTDLLILGLSATDYVGHSTGTEGSEMCMQMLALDRELGDFFARLDATGIDYVVALTADHGGHDLPERNRQNAWPAAERVDKALDPDAMGKAVAEKLGLPQPLLYSDGPFGDMYLSKALTPSQRKAAMTELLARYRAHPQVEAVVTGEELAKYPISKRSPDVWSLMDKLRASYNVQRSGDFLVVLKPRVTPIPESGMGYVATHGSVWDYDRRVPILFWRKGLTGFEQPNAVMTVDILPTLASVIGVPLDAGKIDGRCLDLLSGPESSCR
ncbi:MULTISPECIES: alkaline phosphatase family protein [unclassified Sphingopyxis]|uniref:alkaline phosphatase family protein n=1 Tax=unclassified Sphingopyxis TaxID=2614943 RepID=UPI000731851A|nr:MULTISPECIES: alkaline phosphatase family protein [unclassified Sphingopyxis]KTE25822.1 alkaline phosphatase [Sphingopyxis sp. H057]KTE51503.1 alkaline phosphatase [Sphingopyxis sp. H073]KTE53996.1 alkaline phosphatase [Sphingopyxis sp. H071]KTE60276.1 alkaline phosphatase [Sphingopyxis sp. H107]KTE65619.1 alkaline phosphatase [Sphingopyxis sp. H100]